MAAIFEERRGPGQPRFQGSYEKGCGRENYWNLEFSGKTDQTEKHSSPYFCVNADNAHMFSRLNEQILMES